MPAVPQPFHPPVDCVDCWAVPEGAVEELAGVLYQEIVWGREPHHTQVTQEMMAEWRKQAPKYERALAEIFRILEANGHIAWQR